MLEEDLVLHRPSSTSEFILRIYVVTRFVGKYPIATMAPALMEIRHTQQYHPQQSSRHQQCLHKVPTLVSSMGTTVQF